MLKGYAYKKEKWRSHAGFQDTTVFQHSHNSHKSLEINSEKKHDTMLINVYVCR